MTGAGSRRRAGGAEARTSSLQRRRLDSVLLRLRPGRSTGAGSARGSAARRNCTGWCGAESDRHAAESARSLAKLEKTVERTSKAVDSLTTRWGRFVEELVRPAVVRMFRDRGILITRTMERVRSPLSFGNPMEIDILGVNGMKVVAVECKSRLSKDDVDEMGDRLTKFKQAFPKYAQYILYGAVAGIEINEGVDIYAYRKGLFVIRTNGESVEIANDDKFQPLAWD